jgi:putative SOS response-associated peptidase YedK
MRSYRFPDYSAPIVRNQPESRELTMARWAMPSPAFALNGKKSDPGVTNIRYVKSPHWRRWLGIENRCIVPWTSFSENEVRSSRRGIRKMREASQPDVHACAR